MYYKIYKIDYGSSYEIKNYFGLSVLTMKKEDMFANKLVAMHERIGHTNRDIFDVNFFSKNNWGYNKKIIESRTKMDIEVFFTKLISELEKLDDKYIVNGLGEVLSDSQKDWVKGNLKKDTLFQLNILRKSV